MPDIVTKDFVVEKADIDVLGHVNNQVYVRWMEQAATEASNVNGWPTERYFELGAVWVARQHWVEYLRPCIEGDVVTVYTWVEARDAYRSLRRFAMKKGDKLCCVAATEWNFIDLKTRRAHVCPPEVGDCFTCVPADDTRLIEAGVARSLRYAPRKYEA